MFQIPSNRITNKITEKFEDREIILSLTPNSTNLKITE